MREKAGGTAESLVRKYAIQRKATGLNKALSSCTSKEHGKRISLKIIITNSFMIIKASTFREI